MTKTVEKAIEGWSRSVDKSIRLMKESQLAELQISHMMHPSDRLRQKIEELEKELQAEKGRHGY